jgi:sn-glycerol 3-phosphate transport system substrate-binding protein
MTTLRRSSVLFVALLLVAAACGGGDDDDSGGGGDGDGDLASQCPIGAIDELPASEKPVEVTYWHSFPEENERLITEITDAFNTSQQDVRVSLVDQTSYTDTGTAFEAAYGTDNAPDLVLLEDKETQRMVDSQAVVPAQACVDAADYDMSDFLSRVTDYFTVEDALWPMPFNVSNPVLYYNKAAFRAAGLDPDQPPTTLDEITEASQAIVDAGVAPHGYALQIDPGLFEQWTAMAGEEFVDNGNGRDARATAATFDNDAGLEVFEWMDEMVTSGLAENTGRSEGGNINHLLAVGNTTSAMTVWTSAALGTVLTVLASGQFPGVELGVAELPGVPGDGAPFVGGGANYIVKGDDAKVEAAWRYASYLTEPETQAKWAQSGYVPIRQAAVDLPDVQQLWTSEPFYRVAFEQLAEDNPTVAAKGPVIGDFAGVRDAEVEGIEQMIINNVSPADALARALEGADEAIAAYNERAGVG